MGAPRRWIKQLLGLKKSEKIVSSEEEEEKSKSGRDVESWKESKKSREVDKGTFENENVDTEFEDANWQWELDQSSAPSSKNGGQAAEERREEWEGEVEVARLQQDWREEWMGKDAQFQSAADSPTSPELQAAPQLEQDTVEGWATPDVREMLESDPDPTYAPIFQEEDDDVLEVHSVPDQLHHNIIQPELHNGATTTPLPMTQESAARCIQSVYRGFLARRAFRALKGLARLQALANGHTVKRQAAIALRCIQALVKVQARSRAKHVRTSLESQAVQHKLMQQLQHEAPAVKKEEFTFNGWCDKVGSAREVQARLLKRKEAAAKREKAKAYALARQWQAGIRQQPQPQPQQQQQQPQQQQHQAAPVGFHSEKSEWGWNWLERWMAVRPWETQLLDDASERGAAVDVPTMSFISTERKPVNGKSSPGLSNSTTKVSNEKRAITLQVDGCSPSPRKLGNTTQETSPTTPVSSKSPRTSLKDSLTSKPSIGSRSFSTPRERSNLSDNQDKKRLSLPGTVHGARLLAQTAVKSPRTQSPRALSPRVQSPRTPQKPGNPRSKLNGSDVKTSKLSR